MKTTSEHAQEILWRSSSPALPLASLVEALERETVTTTGGTESVLRELRTRPDLFRVLDPRVGPWRSRGAMYAEIRAWTPDLSVLGLRPRPRPCAHWDAVWIRARLRLRPVGCSSWRGSPPPSPTPRVAHVCVNASFTRDHRLLRDSPSICSGAGSSTSRSA